MFCLALSSLRCLLNPKNGRWLVSIVPQSANLKVTAKRLLLAKNINGGQLCIAPDYVLAHHKVRGVTNCFVLVQR